MTYLVYVAWILTIVLAIGELDNLVVRRIAARLGIHFPEVHWLVPGFLSLMLPGLGQFFNGQPLKALFFVSWPFLTIWSYPVPRPWQLLALKTGWILLPWWVIAIVDGVVAGYRIHRRPFQRAAEQAKTDNSTIDYYAYLAARQKGQDSPK